MRLPRLLTISMLVLAAASTAAQLSPAPSDSGTGDGPSGSLTIWVVLPGPAPQRPTTISAEVHEQTAGSFGQTAGNIGTPAGNIGQEPGSVGRAAGDLGQSAGSIGQTAGNFGESLSTLAQAAAAANRVGGEPFRPKHDPAWDRFAQKAQGAFPHLDLTFEEVSAGDLEEKLNSSEGSASAPDLLLGAPLPSSWSRPDSSLLARFGVRTLGRAFPVVQLDSSPMPSARFQPEVSILRRASHAATARAFALWFSDGSDCWTCVQHSHAEDIPVSIAINALHAVLAGQPLGPLADPEMAEFGASTARTLALAASSSARPSPLNIYLDAGPAVANDRFAVVQVRAVLDSERAFGVLHALLVLRTDDSGQWHVLQITPNLRTRQAALAWTMLAVGAGRFVSSHEPQLLGISQAAPLDGDNRPREPELWWDNRGGAALQVVEWQTRTGQEWINSNLFFVPDANSRLRTRVAARFAAALTPYRWRIWSVAANGAMSLSPWRTLNIVSR